MKKIMEIYAVDNGIIFRKFSYSYKIFGGVDIETNEIPIKIGTAKEAFTVLAELFKDQIEITEKTLLHVESLDTETHVTLKIKDNK